MKAPSREEMVNLQSFNPNKSARNEKKMLAFVKVGNYFS